MNDAKTKTKRSMQLRETAGLQFENRFEVTRTIQFQLVKSNYPNVLHFEVGCDFQL